MITRTPEIRLIHDLGRAIEIAPALGAAPRPIS
jgi:hypothetical protein